MCVRVCLYGRVRDQACIFTTRPIPRLSLSLSLTAACACKWGTALWTLSHVRAASPVFSINVDVVVVVILVAVCASRRSAMAPCRASTPRGHGGQGGPRGRAAAGTVYDVISWCVCVACRWASARSRATRAKGAPHSQAQDAATVVAGPKTCPSCVQPPTRRQ